MSDGVHLSSQHLGAGVKQKDPEFKASLGCITCKTKKSCFPPEKVTGDRYLTRLALPVCALAEGTRHKHTDSAQRVRGVRRLGGGV